MRAALLKNQLNFFVDGKAAIYATEDHTPKHLPLQMELIFDST